MATAALERLVRAYRVSLPRNGFAAVENSIVFSKRI